VVSDEPGDARADAQSDPQTYAPARRKKAEDTSDGCRALAKDDRNRAAAIGNDHMRLQLERSADAWAARAHLLDRLEANFNARAGGHGPGPNAEMNDDGQGTGSIEQGEAQVESQSQEGPERAGAEVLSALPPVGRKEANAD
jgi:hypothetical protein